MLNPNENALAMKLGGDDNKSDISKYFGIDYKPRPQDCKQFSKCNALVCPHDRNWRKRTHHKGEPVCFYLKEYSKAYVRPILRGFIGTKQYQVIAEVHPRVVLTHEPIKVVLARASRNSSRLVRLAKTQVA